MSDLEMRSQEDLTPEEPVDEDQETDLKVDEGEKKDDLDEASEGKEAEGKKEEEDKTPTVEEQLVLRESENKELRVLLRDGKRATDELTRRIEASEAALDKAGLVTEEEKQAAAEQQAGFDTRKRELDNILEATRLSRKYDDVDTVVSQANFDSTVDIMAGEYAVQNGVSQGVAVEAVEGWVWSLTNPYRFMYEKIKETHPSYSKVKEDGKGKLPPNAPGSIQDIHGGAGDTTLTGWTAARIDGLPEDKLDTVPKDIYAKYLRNELK